MPDEYNAPEVDALAALASQAAGTAAALGDLARQMGRGQDAEVLHAQAGAMSATAAQLRRLARTIT